MYVDRFIPLDIRHKPDMDYVVKAIRYGSHLAFYTNYTCVSSFPAEPFTQ